MSLLCVLCDMNTSFARLKCDMAVPVVLCEMGDWRTTVSFLNFLFRAPKRGLVTAKKRRNSEMYIVFDFNFPKF